MPDTFTVQYSVPDAFARIDHAIVRGSLTGECVDYHELAAPGGGLCIVAVYEKHYLRVENRLTLTVVVDNFSGATRVHCVGGGGGSGLFSFDWGAADSFESAVRGAF